MNATKKNIALFGFIVLSLFIILNIASYYMLKTYVNVSIFDNKTYLNKLKPFKKSKIGTYFAHPYYGLALNTGEPGFNSDVSQEYNFVSVSTPPTVGEVKILVLGGSVASHLSLAREDIIETNLFATLLNNHFNTDRFVVYNAAFGGGKQPQQYFKWLYLDYLGFNPDIVINIDGFNEVALPFSENLPHKLNAVFPRSYSKTVGATIADIKCVSLNNNFVEWNSYVPFVELIKWFYVSFCHKELTFDRKGWRHTSKHLFKTESENYEKQTIRIWEKASNKLNELLTNKGIPYIHVIQANQYLPHSKLYSDIEEQRYLALSAHYGRPVKEHYEKFQVSKLNALFVRDQRFLFRETDETVYSDSCCHFNKLGMTMIIQDIINNFHTVFEDTLKGKDS